MFMVNKCLPAPLGLVGKWKKGNSGNEGVLTMLQHGQPVLSTGKGDQNTCGCLGSSLPSLVSEA